MAGQANYCDLMALQPGMSCVIEVDNVNSPTGLWFGVVGEVEVVDKGRKWLRVTAIIKGRCEYEPMRGAYCTDEHSGGTPHLNYRVFPDTPTTRLWIGRLRQAQNETAQMRADSDSWRAVHLATVEHLVRTGAVVSDADMPRIRERSDELAKASS